MCYTYIRHFVPLKYTTIPLELDLWGFVFMFNIFYKNLIEFQIEEYIEWKKARGVVIPEDTIRSFIKFCNKKDIRDIQNSDVENYFNYIKSIVNGNYGMITIMKDVRAIFRYFNARKYQVVNPNSININEHGVLLVPTQYDRIGDMEKVKHIGRPFKMEDIKKIKILRDEAKLPWRAIALAMKKDVKSVYRSYHHKLPSELLA